MRTNGALASPKLSSATIPATNKPGLVVAISAETLGQTTHKTAPPKQSWADIAGKAITAEFTKVKRSQGSKRKPLPKGADLYRATRTDRVLIRLLDEYYINKHSTGLKLEIANALDLEYD